MAKVIAIANQKGGVGKTATVVSVGAELKRRGYRILAIDLDPQANLSAWAGADRRAVSTIYDVIKGEGNIKEAIQFLEMFDVVPAPAEGVMGSAEQTVIEFGKEFRLREALAEVSDDYDYILIDNKPDSLGVLPVNALAAADSIIIPTEADGSAADGIYLLGNHIAIAQKYYNPALKIDGILLTKFSERIKINRTMRSLIEKLAQRYHAPVFETFIRQTAKMKEACIRRQDIGSYDALCTAAVDYRDFVSEYLKKEELA